MGQAQLSLNRSLGRSQRLQTGLLAGRVGGCQPLDVADWSRVYKGEHVFTFIKIFEKH